MSRRALGLLLGVLVAVLVVTAMAWTLGWETGRRQQPPIPIQAVTRPAAAEPDLAPTAIMPSDPEVVFLWAKLVPSQWANLTRLLRESCGRDVP